MAAQFLKFFYTTAQFLKVVAYMQPQLNAGTICLTDFFKTLIKYFHFTGYF